MRRDLGFKLRDAGKGLLDFAKFMERQNAPYITQALALVWAQQSSHCQAAYWARRLSFVRGFAQYRSATDPRTQIPAKGLLPFQPKRARPYLYSEREIRGLSFAKSLRRHHKDFFRLDVSTLVLDGRLVRRPVKNARRKGNRACPGFRKESLVFRAIAL